MNESVRRALQAELQGIREAGTWKDERVIASPQGPEIVLADGRRVLNFCANNYLGLSSHPDVVAAAHRALDSHGFGLSSVRFICGTQDLHKTLERRIADFLGTEDTILYAACFDANGGVFEPLLGEDDAIVSDALNHASIIDGIRLCKAKRWRYDHGDMASLERCLTEARATKDSSISTPSPGASGAAMPPSTIGNFECASSCSIAFSPSEYSRMYAAGEAMHTCSPAANMTAPPHRCGASRA